MFRNTTLVLIGLLIGFIVAGSLEVASTLPSDSPAFEIWRE